MTESRAPYPFRVDRGGADPGSLPAVPAPPGEPVAGAPVPTAAPPASARPSAWTAGRVVALVLGSVLLFAAAGCLIGGGTLLWAEHRRGGGFLLTPSSRIVTDQHAVTASGFRLGGAGADWAADDVLGRVRIDVTPADAATTLFVGVARSGAVARYLSGVGRSEVRDLALGAPSTWTTTEHAGVAPDSLPAQAGIWAAASSGSGTRTVIWRPAAGDWTLVVMRADGGRGLTADVRAGATLPALPWVAGSLLGTGVVLAAIGGLLVGLAVHRAQPPPGQPPAPPPGALSAQPGAAAAVAASRD